MSRGIDGDLDVVMAEQREPLRNQEARTREAEKLSVKCPYLLLPFLLTCMLIAGQSTARAESITLPSSRWVTPVQLTSVTTRRGPGVTLEYKQPCLAEAGNRLRKLVHNFGRKGFVLVQYQTPYTATAEHCPSGTLFFLSEQEAPTVPP